MIFPDRLLGRGHHHCVHSLGKNQAPLALGLENGWREGK